SAGSPGSSSRRSIRRDRRPTSSVRAAARSSAPTISTSRTPSCEKSGCRPAPSGGRRTSPRPKAGTPTRSYKRRVLPMAVRGTETTSDEPRGLGLVDLLPIKPRVLAMRIIARVDEQLAAEWKLPDGLRACGMLTCTSDDALFVALDE